MHSSKAFIAMPLLILPLLAAAPATATSVPATPQTLSRETRADLPEVRRSVDLTFASVDPNGWSGQISFGLVTSGSGDARVVRPAPMTLHLQRRTCDMTGCVLTTMDLPDGASIPSAARIAAQVSSASLGPVVIGVVVRRTVDGTASLVQQGTVSISAVARRSGPVVRETRLVQSGDAEQMTITLSAPVRAVVSLGDDTLAATGTAAKVRIVTPR